MIEINEFHSKLEDLMTTEELFFDSTPGFGSFYKKYLSHAIAHPAKMNTKLLNFLIEQFTKEGDTVLDPMCGSGSTGVVAALHGRNAVQVDIEKKFVDWAEEAKKKVEIQATLTAKGSIRNICGDSRQLSSLLKEVDVVVTSPPYSEGIGHDSGDKASEEHKERLEMQRRYTRQMTSKENIAHLPHGNVDAVITSPPYADQEVGKGIRKKRWEKIKDREGFKGRKEWKTGTPSHYSESEENIGNLKYDAVITSPPYADTKKGGEADDEKMAERWDKTAKERNWNTWGKTWKTEGRKRALKSLGSGYSKDEENIGNLPFDAVITSPPYEASVSDDKEGPLTGGNERKYGRWKKSTAQKHSYTQRDEPCKVDAVITSPPYESSLEGSTRHTKGGIASRDPALAQTGTYATRLSFGVPVGYSPKRNNIGNLKSTDEEYASLVDAVITSPPYAHESSAAKPTKLEKQGLFKMGHSSEEAYTDEDYRQWDKHKGGNIGKRKLFIRIPCGKEEAQFHDTRKGRKGTIWEYTREVEATPEIIEQVQQLKSEKKGKSETYLEAMLKCYQEMFKVLKPNGKAIIIIKPFIRNKKVVDLPYHTWLLLEKVGFKLVKLFKLKLKNVSFWRILYHKRYPSVPTIKHEWILICEKV